MRASIDKAGRVVIPKALRDQLNLEAGTELEVRAHDGHLDLEPIATPMQLVRRGKGLVATTDAALPTLDEHDVREVTERLRR